ncbi:class I SAM-dependent methyltransferase [Rhizosaccharibacter radicis]|uniref:Class I SAM-dependent methyltransferase n=1 Tax=Rhizosaccharibacter radicis TaxID=2782605 RepID=A0ABT1VUH9_9PROT|nr:class I SAM-dependent methyltransferase [Acetobacteraceae bacterium KSS12]
MSDATSRAAGRAEGPADDGDAFPMLPLKAGRRAFGHDPEGYAAARPSYPSALWDAVDAACSLRDASVFEVGPGTGAATLPLLRRSPRRLVAIEPDARLAAYLERRAASPGDRLQIRREPFEEAALGAGEFDLGVAATSFHWLDQRPALRQARRALRPGGLWAMWWTVFTDPDLADPFTEACAPIFCALPSSRTLRTGRAPFALDEPARLADLRAAGFGACTAQRFRWRTAMDADATVALTATFSQVSQAMSAAREAALSAIGALVRDRFGGRLERHFVSVLYLARNGDE